jgi:hypothetical protein
MSELADNIARYLEVKIDPRQTNYYSLLGLKEGESDTVQIGAGLKRAFDRLKANKSAEDLKNWDQVARLVQQVQSVLLDPAKKAAYDQKLDAAKSAKARPNPANVATKKNISEPVETTQRPTSANRVAPEASNQLASKQSVAVSTAKAPPAIVPVSTDPTKFAAPNIAPETISSSSIAVQEKPPALIALLPTADPTAAFDFPGYVRDQGTTHAETESVEERLDALKFLLQKDIRRGPPSLPSRNGLEPQSRFALPKAPSMTQRARLSQRLALSSGVLTVLMLFGAGGVVAFGWWMVKTPKKSTVAQNNVGPEKVIIRPPSKPVAQPAESTKPRKPIVSSLPTVGSAADEEKAARAQAMLAASADELKQAADAAMEAQPDSPQEPMKNDSDPDMSNTTPEVTTPMATELTAEEKAALAASLNAARDSLPKQDFVTFHKEMEKSLSLARSPEDAKKYRRLNQLGLLHEQFVEALSDGMKRLKSGGEIKVGSSQVAVVEIKTKAIIVRDKGQNKEYGFDQIPVALALGIVDLSLSKEKPVDVAARGVFCLIHPTHTKLNESKGKSFIDQAIPSDEIHDDLLEALTDKY